MILSLEDVAKAKRTPRPEWQDTVPADVEQRHAYAIAARHVGKFARAYRQAVGDMSSAVSDKALEAAIRTQNPEAVIDAIPFAEPGQRGTIWSRASRRFDSASGSLIEESGRAELKRLGFELPDPVQKAAFTLDNPFSIPWIEANTAKLITDLNASSQRAIRETVARGFREGFPPRDMAKEIRSVIGLTAREAKAVTRRRTQLLAEGLNATVAGKRAEAYAAQLLRQRARRIARTETIRAENQGLRDSWQAASDAGLVPATAEKEWFAAMGSNRTCPICIGLDGDKVPVDQPFMSAIVGAVDMPPAHSMCRCSAGLVL